LILVFPFGHQVRTAIGTEVTQFPRRRFKATQMFLPLQPTKLIAIGARRRCETRSMCLTTRLAVTVTYWTKPIHFVSNRTAETTTLHCDLMRSSETFQEFFYSLNAACKRLRKSTVPKQSGERSERI
jgi:hypothetical protein